MSKARQTTKQTVQEDLIPIPSTDIKPSSFPSPSSDSWSSPSFDLSSSFDPSTYKLLHVTPQQYCQLFNVSDDVCTLFSPSTDSSLGNSLRNKHPHPERVSNFYINLTSSSLLPCRILSHCFAFCRSFAHLIEEERFLWELMSEVSSKQTTKYSTSLFKWNGELKFSEIIVDDSIPILFNQTDLQSKVIDSFDDVPAELYSKVIHLFPYLNPGINNCLELWPVYLSKALLKAINCRYFDLDYSFVIPSLTGWMIEECFYPQVYPQVYPGVTKINWSCSEISCFEMTLAEENCVVEDSLKELSKTDVILLGAEASCPVALVKRSANQIDDVSIAITSVIEESNLTQQCLRCHLPCPTSELSGEFLNFCEDALTPELENLFDTSIYCKNQQILKNDQNLVSEYDPTHFDLFVSTERLIPSYFKYLKFSPFSKYSCNFTQTYSVLETRPGKVFLPVNANCGASCIVLFENLNLYENVNFGTNSNFSVTVSVLSLDNYSLFSSKSYSISHVKFVSLDLNFNFNSLLIFEFVDVNYGLVFSVFSNSSDLKCVISDDFSDFQSTDLVHSSTTCTRDLVGYLNVNISNIKTMILIAEHVLDAPTFAEKDGNKLLFPPSQSKLIDLELIDFDSLNTLEIIRSSIYPLDIESISKSNTISNCTFLVYLNQNPSKPVSQGKIKFTAINSEVSDFESFEFSKFSINNAALDKSLSYLLLRIQSKADTIVSFSTDSDQNFSIYHFLIDDVLELFSYRPPSPVSVQSVSDSCLFRIRTGINYVKVNLPSNFESTLYCQYCKDVIESIVIDKSQSTELSRSKSSITSSDPNRFKVAATYLQKQSESSPEVRLSLVPSKDAKRDHCFLKEN
ncbi:hypothetical protein GEMRC1_000511 [Eukaryota sp. GEM-RC1]